MTPLSPSSNNKWESFRSLTQVSKFYLRKLRVIFLIIKLMRRVLAKNAFFILFSKYKELFFILTISECRA